jgi:hypothetical protein
VADGVPEPSPNTADVLALLADLHTQIPDLSRALVEQRCSPVRERQFGQLLVNYGVLIGFHALRRSASGSPSVFGEWPPAPP